MRKKTTSCAKPKCYNEIFCLGLCIEHYEKDRELKELLTEAIHALHFGTIDSSLPMNLIVSEDLRKIRNWWDDICRAINMESEHPILRDEIKFAKEWAISLTKELVKFERLHRLNQDTTYAIDTLTHTQNWVWERFENLEAGLRSNGLPR